MVGGHERNDTHRYNAACEGIVFSSRTASGFRFGGVLAAEAAPRSAVMVSVSVLPHVAISGLTSANALASKATGATTDQSGLILKYHLSRALIRGVHNCRHRRRLSLVKDFIQSEARGLSQR